MIYRDCLGVLKNLSQIENNIFAWEKVAKEIHPDIPFDTILEKIIELYKSQSSYR